MNKPSSISEVKQENLVYLKATKNQSDSTQSKKQERRKPTILAETTKESQYNTRFNSIRNFE